MTAFEFVIETVEYYSVPFKKNVNLNFPTSFVLDAFFMVLVFWCWIFLFDLINYADQ